MTMKSLQNCVDRKADIGNSEGKIGPSRSSEVKIMRQRGDLKRLSIVTRPRKRLLQASGPIPL